jgi:glycosyltransferase involved in cell wall biosynthesis
MSPAPVASVVLTTKNRRHELRAALTSVARQTVRVETVVIDDGSDDGTAEMVRAEFPTVRLYPRPESVGLIVRRNELAELARAPIVVSLDDDAVFSTPAVVEQTLRDFDHPRIGAVAIPLVNVRQSGAVLQRAPDADGAYALAEYVGTAHALRRDLFRALGGYRGHLVHQGEEGDYCVRLLGAGYVVRAGRADPIHHFESPLRSSARTDFYGRRNDVLFAWHNCPLARLPGRAAASTVSGLAFGLKVRRPFRMAAGLLGGFAGCVRFWSQRRPVRPATFALYRWLRKNGPVPLDELVARLPECAPVLAPEPAV